MSRRGATRAVLAVLAVVSVVSCAGSATDQPPAASDPTASGPGTGTEEEETARADGGTCRSLAPIIEPELRRWAGADDVMSAPIAESLLGPRQDDGAPGMLVDGCVWEVRGSAGGHIGVAVERFTEVDMNAVESTAGEAGVEPIGSADGKRSWYVPPSGGTPSGAVLVGDRAHLVVVRVESYSETDGGAVLGDDGRAERFFSVVSGALRDAHPD